MEIYWQGQAVCSNFLQMPGNFQRNPEAAYENQRLPLCGQGI